MDFSEHRPRLRQTISEKIEKAEDQSSELTAEAYIKRQPQILKEKFDAEGFKGVAKEQLGVFNVKVDYRSSGRADFQSMRDRLHREPGLVISNHPYAPVDGPLILSLIDRQDVQVVVRRDVHEQFARIFGEKYFLPAQKDALGKVSSHIADGGVTLIFPGGRGDAEWNIHFKKGFGKIIESMDPESMVYAFHLDADFHEMNERFPGAFSDVFSRGAINANNFKKPLLMPVDERYTQVKDWQQVAAKASDQKWIQTDFDEYYKSVFKDAIP